MYFVSHDTCKMDHRELVYFILILVSMNIQTSANGLNSKKIFIRSNAADTLRSNLILQRVRRFTGYLSSADLDLGNRAIVDPDRGKTKTDKDKKKLENLLKDLKNSPSKSTPIWRIKI